MHHLLAVHPIALLCGLPHSLRHILSVWIAWIEAAQYLRYTWPTKALLLLRYAAILVRVQQRLESEDIVFVAIDLLRQGVVFARVDFDLGL